MSNLVGLLGIEPGLYKFLAKFPGNAAGIPVEN